MERNKKTISVWLIVADGEQAGAVALQRRSRENKHFHNICQSTWSGKVEEDEGIEQAVVRECREELGELFAKNFNFSALKMFRKENFKLREKQYSCYNYIGLVTAEALSSATLCKEAYPKFEFVQKLEEAVVYDQEVNVKNTKALFTDQYKALKDVLHHEIRRNTK